MTSIGLRAVKSVHMWLPMILDSKERSRLGCCHTTAPSAPRPLTSLVLFLLAMLSGCCKPFDRQTKQENDAAQAWVTGSWRGQYAWTRIAHWNHVTEPKVLRADSLLQSLPAIQITAKVAQELTGESSPNDAKETPYLLRAVGDANGTFPLELDVRPDGTVWAGGGANSKCPVGMRRRPVVVWLNRLPEQVYVTFYVNHD